VFPWINTDWKPHEKSMALGRLAIHIADNFRWAWYIIESDFVDFANRPFGPSNAATTEELLSIFDSHFNKTVEALQSVDNAELEKKWTVKSGEAIYMEPVKCMAIKSWAINHLIHHRGQLSVYLRLLDVPVPGMYGPSADKI